MRHDFADSCRRRRREENNEKGYLLLHEYNNVNHLFNIFVWSRYVKYLLLQPSFVVHIWNTSCSRLSVRLIYVATLPTIVYSNYLYEEQEKRNSRLESVSEVCTKEDLTEQEPYGLFG